MTFPLVRDLDGDGFLVTVTTRVLGSSTQAYYRWLADPVSQRDWEDAHLLNAIIDVHRDDPEFGYLLIADGVNATGHRTSENRGQRLCGLQKVASRTVKRRRGSGKQLGPAVTDDLVQRDFTAERPDEVWLTDITEHGISTGKVYVCAVKDVCSRRIVGWSIGPRMTEEHANTVLGMAIVRRRPSGTVLYSDNKGQFRSRRYQRTLRVHGLRGSMGGVASAGDNAAMESFFALLQKYLLNRQPWNDRDQLHSAILTWVESTYNHRRRQRALGRLTPAEFESLIGYNFLVVAA
jgi:putative transposase